MTQEQFAWANDTLLHPLGLAAVLVLGVATLVLPRRYAIAPMILLVCLIPARQRLVVASIDFTLLRIMVMFAWIRLLTRGELFALRLIPLDYAIIAWTVFATLIPVIRTGSSGALVNGLGHSFDAIGMYFLFRALIRTPRDLRATALCFAAIALPVLVAFIVENQTGRNAFSVFGGVPAQTLEREGRLRCQGAFSHPILAGCFWASVLPLMGAWCWSRGSARVLAIVGLVAGLGIVILCASSTPLGGIAAILVGAAIFPLHIVMKAPVWHLIARIDLAGGSTGWHRYQLIDRAIRYFHEWWLVGTDSTGHWGHLTTDITNQYVLEGVQGGLITLLLFVATLWLGFQAVGRVLAAYRRDRFNRVMAWCLGLSLFAHSTMFIAVSYFGQIMMAWYLSLAMAGSASVFARRHVRARRTRRVPAPVPAGVLTRRAQGG